MSTATPVDPTQQHVVGPDALKGLAHPLRLRLLAELNARGSATASQLGDALGESSGSTSYHLRQLHKHGFVEEDADRAPRASASGSRDVAAGASPRSSCPPTRPAPPAVDLVLKAQLHADQQRVLDVVAQAAELAPGVAAT